MARYILRRALYSVLILVGVTLITFLMFYIIQSPRSIAKRNLGKNPTEQQVQQWLKEKGYDKPRHELFVKHVTELFTFRFGRTDQTDEDIWGRIRQGAPPSFQVASVIFMGVVFGSVTFALLMAYFRGTYLDYWGTFLAVFLLSVVYPVYIIGGQFILGKMFKYYPLAGWAAGMDTWKFVWLPATVGLVAGLGNSSRLYRTFMLEEISQDYVRTARAKGVGERRVLFVHVLKNAAIPILTSVVAAIPLLFTGSILLESFFGIPGLGSFLLDGINAADFAVIRSMVFLGTVLYIIGYLLTDISYALVDPRVRFE